MPSYAAPLTLVVFVAAYALFAFLPNRRSVVSLTAAAIMILSGCLGIAAGIGGGLGDAVVSGARAAFVGAGGDAPIVSWNVMGLFFGMLILAEVFLQSQAPAVISEKLVANCSSPRMAMLVICALAGFISMFVENVAVVLLLAPIVFSIARRLETSPVALLIGVAICSNLQGTATMVGDPPSMILAGYMKMGFWDFFWYRGRPGIFFAVQVGAIAAFAVLYLFFRSHRGTVSIRASEKAKSWVPFWFLIALIAGLSFSSMVDPEFRWYAGALTVGLAALELAWYAVRARWVPIRRLLGCLDWDTTFFLIGVFVLVGALSASGWLESLAQLISSAVGGSLLGAFALCVLVSVAISGFVDNVPFLLAMIPVVQRVAELLSDGGGAARHPLETLVFGMLCGACLGGNITPIGASANVVTIGMLKKRGYSVRFRDFMKISVPFTIAAIAASALFIWIVWEVF